MQLEICFVLLRMTVNYGIFPFQINLESSCTDNPTILMKEKRLPQKTPNRRNPVFLNEKLQLFVWITRCIRHSDRLRVDSKAAQKTRSDPRFLLCVAKTARFTLGR